MRHPEWLNDYTVANLHNITTTCGFDYVSGQQARLKSLDETCSDDDLMLYHYWLGAWIWLFVEEDADEAAVDFGEWPTFVFDYFHNFAERPEIKSEIRTWHEQQ